MAVFKALGKSMSVEEKVTVLVRRHEHNYFVGMSADQLQAFTEEVRPTKPIQEQDVTLSKNERLLIKKLAWVWGSDTEVCQAFKDQVRSGEIKSITMAKEEAAKLWKTNSSLYDASRATHAPGTDNNPRGVKRIRLSGETDYQYRKRRMAAIRSEGTEIAVAVPVIQSEDQEQESVSQYRDRIIQNVLGNRDEFLRILKLRTPKTNKF